MKAPKLTSLIIGSVVLLGCKDYGPSNERTALQIAASNDAQTSSGNLVTGSVQITVSGERSRISFTAIRHQDGSVSGEYQLNGRDSRIHAQVLCFRVSAGGVSVGALVDQSSNPVDIGHDLLFITAVPDRISPPLVDLFDNGPIDIFGYHFPDEARAFCFGGLPVTSAGDLPLYQIENGHIEIH